MHLRLARVSWVCSSRPSAYPDGLKSRVLGVGIRPDAVSHQSDLSTVSHSIADSAAEARAPPESLRATVGARCLLAPSGLTAVVPRRERELRLSGRLSRGLRSQRRAPLARRRPCARGWYFATSGWEIQSQVSTIRRAWAPSLQIVCGPAASQDYDLILVKEHGLAWSISVCSQVPKKIESGRNLAREPSGGGRGQQ